MRKSLGGGVGRWGVEVESTGSMKVASAQVSFKNDVQIETTDTQ